MKEKGKKANINKRWGKKNQKITFEKKKHKIFFVGGKKSTTHVFSFFLVFPFEIHSSIPTVIKVFESTNKDGK